MRGENEILPGTDLLPRCVLWIREYRLLNNAGLAEAKKRWDELSGKRPFVPMASDKTLRDAFAMEAMREYVPLIRGPGFDKEIARYAYAVADAMLEARK